MIKVIIAFFILSFPFVYLSKKYANPYKLIFIFGKKGSGKSCSMVHDMIRDLRHGWTVYTDIPNLNIAGVRLISAADLSNFVPVPRSSVYLDEVGISFDNRNFKSFPPGLRDFFKFQRKYRCKIVMNSQSYDVDKKIRDCTDSMVLQSNIGNFISVARPINRRVALVEASANGDSRIADNLKFAPIWKWKFYYMPRYFKYFDSFAAPERPEIRFDTVIDGLRVFREKSPKRVLKGLTDDSTD